MGINLRTSYQYLIDSFLHFNSNLELELEIKSFVKKNNLEFHLDFSEFDFDNKSMIKWCEKNLNAKFLLNFNYQLFSDNEDKLKFILRWA